MLDEGLRHTENLVNSGFFLCAEYGGDLHIDTVKSIMRQAGIQLQQCP